MYREPFYWRELVAEGERCWISARPVTRGQWAQFIRTGAYFKRQWWPHQLASWETMLGDRQGLGGDALLRAVEFSWARRREPIANINWFEAAAYCRWQQGRLPWSGEHKALYGAALTPPKRRWPWSPAPAESAPVAAYLGTKREWCGEWWNPLFRGPVVRAPDASGTRRLFSVGGLDDRMDPCERRNDVGFRIARDDSPTCP